MTGPPASSGGTSSAGGPPLDPRVAEEVVAPAGEAFRRLVEVMAGLRAPGGCPWDREQTHRTLARHLLEETYEVLEAIGSLDVEGGGGFEHLEEELGDLLFQVVFHATLAAEEGRFTLADVARGIHDKLVHRHPHVFGTVAADTAGQVMENWERIKQAEKGRTSLMDGIAAGLPSLLYAHKVLRKAASVGLEPPEGAPAVTDAEVGGELLFAIVDRLRRGGVDPEAALRAVTARFRDRFVEVEQAAAARGLDVGGLDRATVTGLWRSAKPSGRE